MLSDPYEDVLLSWFIFYIDGGCTVLCISANFYCFLPFFFPTGKHIFNFEGEILLRMKSICFLKWKASFLGNGNKGKMLKEGEFLICLFVSDSLICSIVCSGFLCNPEG